jgi:hypothetical protein
MPLLDHFHPPLSTTRHWEAFHAQWAAAIASALNESLPENYFAEAQVHAGPQVEIDVATFEATSPAAGVVTLPRTQPALAAPDLVLPAEFPPTFGVHVFETSGGPSLVAALELVSPGNKDRDETRRAFAAKCTSYLQAGCGLIVVDVVTDRLSRPLDELLRQFYPAVPRPTTGPLTAVSYRPLRADGGDAIELRIRTLAVAGELPELPLALRADEWVSVDLEATYQQARGQSRL